MSSLKSIVVGTVLGLLFLVIVLMSMQKEKIESKPRPEAVRIVSEMKAKYPFTSIAGKLEYEHAQIHLNDRNEVSSNVQLSEEVEDQLKQFEEGDYQHYRSRYLRKLHHIKEREFAQAVGFGQGRMNGWIYDVDLPELASVKLPPPPENQDSYDQPDYEQKKLSDDESKSLGIPTPETLGNLHVSGLDDFLDPMRMGYVKSREEVSGFFSHGFSQVPDFSTGMKSCQKEEDVDKWQIARLELVSLLKHDKPVAYVSETLPQLDKLAGLPTRSLDRFERESLEQLHHQKDVVIESGLNRIRMIGSLRASRSCLDCHNVERGFLLGAFTYEIVRTEPIKSGAEGSENRPST